MGAPGWITLLLLLIGCRELPAGESRESEKPTPAEVGGETQAEAAPSQEGAPRSDGPPRAPTGGPDDAAQAGAPAASTADEPASGCGSQSVTLDQIHAGRVREGATVSVGVLVTVSQKFLVSEAKSGSCLWGAFAAEPKHTGSGSGLFIVSFGDPHGEGEACRRGTDGIPDDLAPGDVISAQGKLDAYAPAGCQGVVPALQFVVDAACPLERRGRSAPPEPAVLDLALADELAAGTNAELLRQWSGALVRLENVSARQDEQDGDAVSSFGVVRLAESALEVHSRLYYFDLNEGGPKASVKAPRYSYPTTFSDITGLVFLDYCSWVLAPRDRCADLSPPSEGCAARATRP